MLTDIILEVQFKCCDFVIYDFQKRSRTEIVKDLSQDNLKKNKLKKKKKKRDGKFGAGFRVFVSKHFDRVLDEHPDMKDKDVDKYLEKMWLDMDEQQKLR